MQTRIMDDQSLAHFLKETWEVVKVKHGISKEGHQRGGSMHWQVDIIVVAWWLWVDDGGKIIITSTTTARRKIVAPQIQVRNDSAKAQCNRNCTLSVQTQQL
jgi:hypothetical protein